MGKIRVLLVDDEQEYVEGLAERMAYDGIDSEIAFSGEEGLEAIGKNPPDVMVLDLRMPGMGGMEVLKRVKRDHPQTQVIILTGHGSPTERKEAIGLGAVDYLKKPIEVRDLMRSVHSAGQKARHQGPVEGSK